MLSRCGRLAVCRRPRLLRNQVNAGLAPLRNPGEQDRNDVLNGNDSIRPISGSPILNDSCPGDEFLNKAPLRADENQVISVHQSVDIKNDGESAPIQRTRKRKTKSSSSPARLKASSINENHHDLASFLEYANRVDLNPRTNVYTGTHYEYTVAHALKSFRFELHRTGRSNDLGMDLVGDWKLPRRSEDASPMKVLIQCKAVKPTPSMVRELEGVHVGAPMGWNGIDALALLVANQESTKGVREALQRSTRPMGFMQITREGDIKQFTWNYVAAQAGLSDLGVTSIYGGQRKGDGLKASSMVQANMALTWKGKLWPTQKS